METKVKELTYHLVVSDKRRAVYGHSQNQSSHKCVVGLCNFLEALLFVTYRDCILVIHSTNSPRKISGTTHTHRIERFAKGTELKIE